MPILDVYENETNGVQDIRRAINYGRKQALAGLSGEDKFDQERVLKRLRRLNGEETMYLVLLYIAMRAIKQDIL